MKFMPNNLFSPVPKSLLSLLARQVGGTLLPSTFMGDDGRLPLGPLLLSCTSFKALKHNEKTSSLHTVSGTGWLCSGRHGTDLSSAQNDLQARGNGGFRSQVLEQFGTPDHNCLLTRLNYEKAQTE